jgi:hypothetical protein
MNRLSKFFRKHPSCAWSLIFIAPLLFSCCSSDSGDSPDNPESSTEEADTVKQQVRAETSHVDVWTKGGEAYVFLKTYSKLKNAPALTTDASWVKEVSHSVISSENDGFQNVVYVLDVEENKDLGRTADLTFNYKDTKGNNGEPVHVTLHQYPRNLKPTENITVERPGQLRYLLGGDANAWTKLKTLKLSGQLNTSDMRTLRLLLRREVRSYLSQRTPNGYQEYGFSSTMNLRHLDLGNCQLVENGDTAIEESIEDPDYSYTQKTNVLGDNAFFVAGCKLESVILPQGLTEIGDDAFHLCEGLISIDIPASVKKIGDYAFFCCSNLTVINIPEDSQLESLGIYALRTGTRLKTITFPTSLDVVEREGILGLVSAENIHVKWTVPPTLSRFRIADTTTLWVPKGTADAYKAATGWNHAKEIKEE